MLGGCVLPVGGQVGGHGQPGRHGIWGWWGGVGSRPGGCLQRRQPLAGRLMLWIEGKNIFQGDDLVFNVVYQVDQPQPGQFLAFILGYEL